MLLFAICSALTRMQGRRHWFWQLSNDKSDVEIDFEKYSERINQQQWCIIRLTCSHLELTKDHVLTSAYVIIFEPSREML